MSNEEVDDSVKSKIVEGHFPHGASLRSLAHYSQIYTDKRFAYYDYGSAQQNIAAYGQGMPPEIDLEAIGDVPIAMWAG